MEQLMLKLAQNTNIKPKMKHYTLYIYICIQYTITRKQWKEKANI